MNSSFIKTDKALFAAGCFWGVEYYFKKAKGVVSTSVGFTGGSTKNPSYQDVCGGNTGHAEAVEVVFDPVETTYETLAKQFFEIHNPSLIRKSDTERSQYRSAIFCINSEQKLVAEKLVQMLKDKGFEVFTEINSATTFYAAEEYHQDYYNKKSKDDYGFRRKQKF